MPTARQWERVADQVCRALGGRHGAARVVCPVGVRLLREVAASRLEGRPGSAAKVVDSARLTIRSLAGLPDPEAPDDEVQAEKPDFPLQIPAVPLREPQTLKNARGFGGRHIRGIGRTVADLVRPKIRKKLIGVARHAVNGGFIPGESGF